MTEEIKVPEGGHLQRDNAHYMLRARVFLGDLSQEALNTLIEVAEKNNTKVRLTYRQNVQLYQFSSDEVTEAMTSLEAQGLACKGRLGDIVVNALTGNLKDEAFDVTPYASKLWQWLNESGRLKELPGKFKMAFSSNEDDEGNATFADLGFYAKMIDGKPHFDIYAGGSLGAMPMLGIKIEENLPSEAFLQTADKLTKLYVELFEGAKVFKKRLRFKVRELGEAAFLARYQEKESSEALFFVENKQEAHFSEDREGLISLSNGKYGVKIKPVDGELSIDFLKKLRDVLGRFAYEVRLKIGSRHELYVFDLTAEDAYQVKALADDALKEDKVIQNDIQTCVGSAKCTFGFTNTKALLESLEGIEDLPKLAISGCMNSCAQHQVADIGFFGRKPHPTDFGEDLYEIFSGGALKAGDKEGMLGVAKGKILAKNIPLYLKELQTKKGSLSWQAYLSDWEALPKTYIEKE